MRVDPEKEALRKKFHELLNPMAPFIILGLFDLNSAIMLLPDWFANLGAYGFMLFPSINHMASNLFASGKSQVGGAMILNLGGGFLFYFTLFVLLVLFFLFKTYQKFKSQWTVSSGVIVKEGLRLLVVLSALLIFVYSMTFLLSPPETVSQALAKGAEPAWTAWCLRHSPIVPGLYYLTLLINWHIKLLEEEGDDKSC